MTIYSLDILLFLFGTSLLFHELLLPDLHIGFSRSRSGGLVCHLFQNFPQFIVMHTVKGFGIVNKAEIYVFLELSCFFNDPANVGNLISGSSAFSKTSLNIWKFMVHVLLKPGLENFEHYFTSMWDECNCAVVWAFSGIAFLWDWNENWLFQSCGHCWVFQICYSVVNPTCAYSCFLFFASLGTNMLSRTKLTQEKGQCT